MTTEPTKNALSWMKVLNQAARPYLTVMFATSYNIVCVVAVMTGMMSIDTFITANAPIVATLLGFWFGERAALKDPGRPE
jgi:hypothetical protein